MKKSFLTAIAKLREKKYIPLGTESRGCFTVSRSCVEKVMQIYKESSRRRPVLIYAKYK